VEYRYDESRTARAGLCRCQRRRKEGGRPGGSASGELDWDGIIAYTVSATSWTWDYTEWNLDIPRLTALNAHWRLLPPVPLQLARIAASLGIKSSEAENSATPEGSDEQAESLVQNFPIAPAQPYMSAEEYLRRKAQG
jgi:hypothetical protein